jgi:putative aldouronate transport system permease protein
LPFRKVRIVLKAASIIKRQERRAKQHGRRRKKDGGIVLKTSQLNMNMQQTIGRIRKNWGLYVLLLPAVVLLLLFSYKPMYGVLIAFKDYSPALGIMDSPWAGLKYFEKFFNSYQFSSTIKNTLIISFYSIATFPIPIMLALMINQMRVNRFKHVFQTVTYMPHFISTVVMVGLILILSSPSTGLIGNIYRLLGAEAPNLMGSAEWFSSVYVWTDVWQHAGWDSIIFIAALSAVDPSLYEAAKVDGASRWQRIRFIDIPMLLPTAIILLILRIGGLLGVGFEKVYLMQNNLNISSSEVIATYVYKIGMLSSQYSFSSAINLFNTIINFILLILVNQAAKKYSENSLW